MKKKNNGKFSWSRGMRNIFWFFWTGKYSIAAPVPSCSDHSNGHAVHELVAIGGSGSGGDSRGNSSNTSGDNNMNSGAANAGGAASVAASSMSNNMIAFGGGYGSREDKDHAV